jgi:glycosyltransferase involved in cell wall biosynthesis
MIDVSFIIPSYNSCKTIARTFESIFQQKTFSCIKEIIVVDSSDDRKTRALLDDSKLKAILLDKKTSPALGRNIGAQNATGNLLCFIDSDVYLDENWLENILEAYNNGCRAGGGSVSIPDFQSKSNLALAQLYLQFNEFLETGEKRQMFMVPACNMFVERELFNKTGGFPNIRASEDVLLCLRLSDLAKVWLVPGARCFHVFRDSLQSYFNNQKILGKHIIIYRRMISPKWYYMGAWPVLLLPAFLIIKMTRIKLRIYKAGWQHYKKFVVSSPLFLAGLFYWSIGFVQGCFSKEKHEYKG